MDSGTPFNRWGVAVVADRVVILGQPKKLSHQDALELAAWLVALVPDGPQRFPDILRAVCNT